MTPLLVNEGSGEREEKGGREDADDTIVASDVVSFNRRRLCSAYKLDTLPYVRRVPFEARHGRNPKCPPPNFARGPSNSANCAGAIALQRNLKEPPLNLRAGMSASFI